jgi:broad specificity phosphatase PhoE
MSSPTLYYVRHGLTNWNMDGRLQGQHDVELNDQGRAQARHCADVLRDLAVRAGHAPAELDYASSQLIRARETMDLIRATLGLPAGGYSVDDRLGEISFGEWEGLTYQDVLARDSEVVAKREGNKWRFLPPGGESYEQLAIRVGAWYATIERDTVATAHGGTARALIGLLGIVPPEEAAHYPIDNGAIYVFAGKSVTRYV